MKATDKIEALIAKQWHDLEELNKLHGGELQVQYLKHSGFHIVMDLAEAQQDLQVKLEDDPKFDEDPALLASLELAERRVDGLRVQMVRLRDGG